MSFFFCRSATFFSRVSIFFVNYNLSCSTIRHYSNFVETKPSRSCASYFTEFSIMWRLFRSMKLFILSRKLMLIEFISSFRCLSVLFYFKDCANIAPDVALRLFLRRLRLCKFVFTAMAIPKSSPPLSLIRLFDKSSRSTNEFYSIASANALAEASRNSLCMALTSLIEDAVYRASPRATPPKSPNLQ